MAITTRAAELRAAADEARHVRPPERPVAQLVLVAPGSAGVLAEAIAALGCAVPTARAGLEMPRYVGPATLVLGLARSGEHLDGALLAEAARRGAHVVLVGDAPAPGAPQGATLVPIASGRAGIALSSLLGAAVGIAERSEILDLGDGAIEQAAIQLDVRAGAPEAEALARAIDRTFPLTWGAAGLGAVAATAWRDEVQLRAKAPAFAARLPEATYVDVAGFGLSGDVTRQVLTLIRLELPDEPPLLSARVAAALEVVRETLHDIVVVRAGGEGPLAHCCDLLLLGEQVARALAAREGVDPDAVPVLEDLERALGGS